jgi:hypothetical protein
MNARDAVAVRARYYARPGRRAIAVLDLDLEVVVGGKVRALASHIEPRDLRGRAADRSAGMRSCAQRNGR